MKKSPIAFAVICAAVCFNWSNPAPAQAQPAKRASTASQPAEPPVRQLIIKYRDETARTFSASVGKSREATLSNKTGMTIAYRRPMSGLSHVYALPQPMSRSEAYALAKRLELVEPSIEYAEPDAMQYALLTPNDTLYVNQWHYKAPDAASLSLVESTPRLHGTFPGGKA